MRGERKKGSEGEGVREGQREGEKYEDGKRRTVRRGEGMKETDVERRKERGESVMEMR